MEEVKNSLFVRACRGERGKRPPVWFMRQAGRYLPEYREIRAKHSMLEVIRTPELAATVTLQPIDRFGFDASIIFADILNPLIGMGADLEFVEKEGPVIRNPVRSAADVERLAIPEAEENTGYTFEAIRMVCRELGPRGVPLIGFAGAPFTLSSYLIEGGSIGGDLGRVKQMMFREPQLWDRLQEKLVIMLIEYLCGQAAAGVSALQIFDSWLGYLGPSQFDRFVAPALSRIVSGVRERTDVPLIFFATGTGALLSRFARLGFDVYGVDWRADLRWAAEQLGTSRPLQGNLDPLALLGPREYLIAETERIIEEGRTLPAHIFNLGHGILPPTPIESVETVLAVVRGEL